MKVGEGRGRWEGRRRKKEGGDFLASSGFP